MKPIVYATVNLTDEEALSFVRYQKHRLFIEKLEAMKAFDIKDGSITIHFGSIGEIRQIEKHEIVRV